MPRVRDDILDNPLKRPRPQSRGCDQPGCGEEGAFRAPRSRDRLGCTDNYFWFCLDHVREYNASWNYYAGMSDAEIERLLRQDLVGQRPTWPLGWRVASRRFRDPLHMFEEAAAEAQEKRAQRRPLSEEERALTVFELETPFELRELKARYKLLVKRHHPDANGGSKEAEERLKVITQAYALLKSRYYP